MFYFPSYLLCDLQQYLKQFFTSTPPTLLTLHSITSGIPYSLVLPSISLAILSQFRLLAPCLFLNLLLLMYSKVESSDHFSSFQSSSFDDLTQIHGFIQNMVVVQLLSHVQITLQIGACHHPIYCSPPGSSVMEFSRQEYWSGLPFPSSGDLPNPGIQPMSPAFQAISLPHISCIY